MVNIKEFHTTAFEYLNELRKNSDGNKKLTFTYRKSNYGGRLEMGYWFYGNDHYICISFWTGMDWKNRTPNIGWFFLENGECQLEINVSDSYEKEQFVERHLVNEIEGLHKEGRKFIKRYGIEPHAGKEFLDLFINGFKPSNTEADKVIIDRAINNYAKDYFNENDANALGEIDEKEFSKREQKAFYYKRILDQDNEEVFFQKEKGNRLKRVSISNFLDIENVSINGIPQNTQWLFLIGENGSGKTSFLKALSTILGYRTLDKTEISEDENFSGTLEFHNSARSNNQTEFIRDRNVNCHYRLPMVSGLVILGPNRLISSQDTKRDRTKFEIQLKKEARFKPLWDFEYRMLDIEDQLDIWFRDSKKLKHNLDERMYYIQSAFVQTVPGLFDIRFSKQYKSGRKRNNLKTTFYLESEKELEKGWRELPSGTRSIFALVGEMIIRLSNFQKDIIDPSELSGIVIIDEIDLHLHPKAQRELIQNLSETFKQVQFVVSTHSPIPILGLKGDGVILHIQRDHNRKIIVDRLRHIEQDIRVMTPNQLLSSDLFGTSSLVSENFEKDDQIITLKNYKDKDFEEQLLSQLSQDLSKEQRDELQKLIDENEGE